MEDNHMNNITTEENEAFLPQGWGENDDIFADPGTWTGAAPADEQVETPEETTGEAPADTAGEPAPTPGQEKADDADAAQPEAAPTTEQASGGEDNKKLKFKARVDREDLDVEMDESDLPAMYQKSQNHDRMSKRLSDADAEAKSLGFADVQDMLKRMAAARQESEVKRLTDDGVHEDVARDLVQRKMSVPEQNKEPAQEPTRVQSRRDYQSEIQELTRAHPELVGKQLPDEVLREAMNGKNMSVAYAEYGMRQAQAEAESLRKQMAIHNQNAAAAARAPVKGTVGGGAPDTKPADLFLQGFNSDY